MRTPHQRHQRYQQQAGWTAALQNHLAAALRLNTAHTILEVGSGTGAASRSLANLLQKTNRRSPQFYGVDLRLDDLTYSQTINPDHRPVCADGLTLPFAAGIFEVVFCHFLLMWLADPLRGLREMRRATRPGGAVIAFAEPDYGGRVDYPEALRALGTLQSDALRAQGADPEMGRKLAGLFHSAGLTNIHSGVLGAEWTESQTAQGSSIEWDTLQNDLAARLTEQDLERLRRIDQAAWQRGERVLYVPTFYCWGIVPE